MTAPLLSFSLGTGDIDFDEFCTLMARMMGLDEEENEAVTHKEAFKMFDERGNGQINATDFRNVLKGLSEKLTVSEVQQIIEEIDPDHDGKINFEGKPSFCFL